MLGRGRGGNGRIGEVEKAITEAKAKDKILNNELLRRQIYIRFISRTHKRPGQEENIVVPPIACRSCKQRTSSNSRVGPMVAHALAS